MPRLSLLILFFILPLLAPAQKRRDSLEARLKQVGQDSERVKTLNNLALEIKRNDQAAGLRMVEESIALAKKIGYTRGMLSGYMVKGHILTGAGEFEKAVATFNEGIAEGKKRGETNMPNLHIRLGFAYMNAGKQSEALAPMREGARMAQESKNWSAASEANRAIGMAYAGLGDHKEATGYFLRSIEDAEKAKDNQLLGYAYLGLGNSFQRQESYDEALSNFEKALATLKKTNFMVGIAGCYLSIGNIHFFREDYDKAVENYRVSLEMSKEMKDIPSVASVNSNIANVLLKQGKTEEALATYKECLATFESLGDVSSQSGILNNIGRSYVQLKRYPEANDAYLRGLAFARQVNNHEWLRDAYSGLSELRYLTGNYKEAYLYKDSLQKEKEIMLGEENKRQTKEMEARFQNRKNEAEILHLQEVRKEQDKVQEEQKKVQAKQQQVIIIVSVGLALVIVLCVFLVHIVRERRKANMRLAEQNAIIATKNKDITDSMTYARRIQAAVLPDEKILRDSVKDMFILHSPRDIVSGDFYWFTRKGDILYVAAADCTGHGVPGALVSVVGINALTQALEGPGAPGSAEVLGKLHRLVLQSLNKDVHLRETRDGMDIALLRIDLKSRTAEFSGAARPLYYCSESTEGVAQLPGDRMSIAGEKAYDDETPYSTHAFSLGNETVIYLTSDGYADQFGGDKGKKFLTRRFADMLAQLWRKPMHEQKTEMENIFVKWKGGLEQVDDVLIVGIRV